MPGIVPVAFCMYSHFIHIEILWSGYHYSHVMDGKKLDQKEDLNLNLRSILLTPNPKFFLFYLIALSWSSLQSFDIVK